MPPYAGLLIPIAIFLAVQTGTLIFVLGGDKRERQEHETKLADHETRIRGTEARVTVMETKCATIHCE